MNLYSFSQQNNDEMGIHVTKDADLDLYNAIYEEAQRLLTISEEIRVSVKKVDKGNQTSKENLTKSKVDIKGDFSKSSFKTTKELSEMTGISSRKINDHLVSEKYMYKKDEDWIPTKKGLEFGGLQKEGQYGKFVIWPEDIIENFNFK